MKIKELEPVIRENAPAIKKGVGKIGGRIAKNEAKKRVKLYFDSQEDKDDFLSEAEVKKWVDDQRRDFYTWYDSL